MQIVEKYLSDERIKIINKENGGLSSARNKGMEEATGEYIYFLDSDDWLELKAIEILVENLEDNLEIIGANFYFFDEIKEKKRLNNLKVKYEEIEEGKYLLLDELEIVVWNKLYKTSFLKKNKIRFLENIIHEDEEFSFKCYMKAKKIKYIQNITYNYRINRIGSIMDEIIKSETKRKNSISSLEKIIEKMEENKIRNKDYFIQIRLKIRQWILRERIVREKNKVFSKKEIFSFEKMIEEIKFRNLNEKEKEVLKKELQELIIKKQFKKLDLCKKQFWKNKILSISILRKIFSKRLREKIKGNKLLE